MRNQLYMRDFLATFDYQVIHAAKSCPLPPAKSATECGKSSVQIHTVGEAPEICLTSIPRTAAISVLQNVHAKLLQFQLYHCL